MSAARSEAVPLTALEGVGEDDARAFADRWLPAWTGNDPAGLVAFYTADAFYRDPAVPAGVQGTDALLAYFTRLLAVFPDWVWTNTAVTPMQDGFLNHWHASIPVAGRRVECDGVCTVRLRDGLIERNEVFFDRTELLVALRGTDS
jgi:SnoaL-like protein